MRIAIVAESFLPRVNGVSNSVVQVTRFLTGAGHQVLIVAPDRYRDDAFELVPVHRVASVSIPGIHDTDVAWSTRESLGRRLRAFAPDVIHLASPFVLGRAAVAAAESMGIPTVAVFQTDVAGFAHHYRLTTVSSLADASLARLHRRADVNLAPSTHALQYLRGLGVPRLAIWGRGVDATAFDPRWRTPELQALPGEVSVGYVGRLAPEKSANILRHLDGVPGIRLVIVGDGPSRRMLEELLPSARFTGRLHGEELSRRVASLDVLVAPGERETFCQVIQEGMAAGVPVVAPAVGGPRDLVEHGRTGFLYEPGSAREMVDHVLHLAACPQLRIEFGANAVRAVASRSWKALGEELMGHYQRAIARCSVRVAS